MTQILELLSKYPLERFEDGEDDVDLFDIDERIIDAQLDDSLDVDIKTNSRCKSGTVEEGRYLCNPEFQNDDKRVKMQPIYKELQKVTGATKIDLKGIKPEHAKVILDTLKEENKYMKINLDNILPSGAGRMASAAFEQEIYRSGKNIVEKVNTLKISAKSIENERNRTDVTSYENLLATYRKAEKDLSDFAHKLDDKSSHRRFEIYSKMADYKIKADMLEIEHNKGKAFRPETVTYLIPPGDDRIKSDILHEIGHYRWHTTLSNEDKTAINNVYRNEKIENFPSEYSTTRSDEFWAENYALWRMGMKAHPIVESIMKNKRR
jgi:hypothetical protein